MLNEARRGFLPAFLHLVDIDLSGHSVSEIQIVTQEARTSDNDRSIIDAKLHLKDKFTAIIESKIGHNSIAISQALKYARLLAASGEPRRVLVFITQIREPLIEQEVIQALAAAGLGSVQCTFLLWRQVFSLLESSESLSKEGSKVSDRRVRKGLSVSSSERLAHMFLSEVRKMTYSLCVIDEQAVGDVADVVIQAQNPWFMQVALRHNVWFPPSQSRFGLRPAKYVAYYQTAGNALPQHISHVARVRKVWNRVGLEDAKQLGEFDSLFDDAAISATVSAFGNKEGLFHIALTDTPVALASPIPLGNPRTAQFLTKKRIDLARLMAARNTDDLLASKLSNHSAANVD